MNGKALTALACLAVLGVAGCGKTDGALAANRKICASFNAKTQAPPAGDAAAPVEDCVRRWAYSLASSHDDADTVAEASVAACSTALSRWNQQSLEQPATPSEALSLTTGQPTNPLAEHNAFAHSRALLYVVQARAGRCAPPPAANGVPEGVTGQSG